MGALLNVNDAMQQAITIGVQIAHLVREVRRDNEGAAEGQKRGGAACVRVHADASAEHIAALRKLGWRKGNPDDAQAGGCWRVVDPDSVYVEKHAERPDGRKRILEWARVKLGYEDVRTMLGADDLDERLERAC